MKTPWGHLQYLLEFQSQCEFSTHSTRYKSKITIKFKLENINNEFQIFLVEVVDRRRRRRRRTKKKSTAARCCCICDWSHWASADPSMSYSVFQHYQDDWWNSGMILCTTWSTLLVPLYSSCCCFEFMVKDGADQVHQQNYKSWGIKQRTDEKLHCCILTANRWRKILAAAAPEFFSQSYCR